MVNSRPSNTTSNTDTQPGFQTRQRKQESTEELLKRLNQTKTHPRNDRKLAWQQKQANERAEHKERVERKRQERETRQAAERRSRRKQRQQSTFTDWRRSTPKPEPKPKKPKAKHRTKRASTPIRVPVQDWFKDFEHRWLQFQGRLHELKKAGYIGINDVPWPEHDMIQELIYETPNARARTKLYHRLSLWLHPDKLMQSVQNHMTKDVALQAEHKACELFQFISACYQSSQ